MKEAGVVVLAVEERVAKGEGQGGPKVEVDGVIGGVAPVVMVIENSDWLCSETEMGSSGCR